MKYYLTFDVGINNLAYCLSSYDNRKTIQDGLNIINWDILDVSFKPLICKHIKNKRAICNAKSTHYLLKDGNTDHSNIANLTGYCKKHVASLKITNKVLHKTLSRVSQNTIFENNFTTQITRLLRALNTFYDNIVNSMYNADGNTCKNIEVYIENQPVLKNHVMKTISICILTFFSLKKITDNTIIKSVDFINAKEKTKNSFIDLMKQKLGIVLNRVYDFKLYKDRKAFAIDTTNQILVKLSPSVLNIVNTIIFENSKKKDDLADTLIYVIYSVLGGGYMF
ncbi:MAG: hypothetical protein Gaeavirus25_4 [Gaeavirus sp.]|uniref:Mitochondrial resolvase Ydc2 catalytic domain-containing protein n=1 Tax=Gaeavirus sp. TaxID=2487767 RepID=A0A3G4ZZD1_9VIRU|nr:MAG: hypothetical protein Gaeavirus25_4 [Gaeavirus sp.]